MEAHLCRCGAHVRILDAIEAARRDRHERRGPMKRYDETMEVPDG